MSFFLIGCDIPNLFWEEEGRKVVDDVVDEEAKIAPPPLTDEEAQKAKRTSDV